MAAHLCAREALKLTVSSLSLSFDVTPDFLIVALQSDFVPANVE